MEDKNKTLITPVNLEGYKENIKEGKIKLFGDALP